MTPGDNRFNFWSSFNAKPKSKYKFLVRFGDNAVFKSNYDINLSGNGFGDEFKNIPNYSWLVKSIDRPKFRIDTGKKYIEGDGFFIGFESPKPENYKWEPISIKLVNVGSHTFHPQEVPKDLDYLLSLLIDGSGYRFSTTDRISRVSDIGLPAINMDIKETAGKDPMQIRSRLLFEPFEIIDLSTDYLADFDSVGTITGSNGQAQNDFTQVFGNPIDKKYLNTQRTFPVGKWNLYEPYLKEVSFGDNSYENDNAFIEYNLQIGYMWAVYTSYMHDDPKKHGV